MVKSPGVFSAAPGVHEIVLPFPVPVALPLPPGNSQANDMFAIGVSASSTIAVSVTGVSTSTRVEDTAIDFTTGGVFGGVIPPPPPPLPPLPPGVGPLGEPPHDASTTPAATATIAATTTRFIGPPLHPVMRAAFPLHESLESRRSACPAP